MFLAAYGLAAIFTLMLVKSIGVPVPVPADVVMLFAATRVAEGKLDLPTVFLVILVALVGGGVVQFWLVQGRGRVFLDRVGPRFGLTPRRLAGASRTLARGGVGGVALAVLLPGARSLAVVACGLARLPLRTFVPGLALGSAAFLALHFVLGIVGLAAVKSVVETLPLSGLISVMVVIVALAGWLLIRWQQRPAAGAAASAAEAVGAWHEAACPVCLLLGAVGRLPASQVESDRTS